MVRDKFLYTTDMAAPGLFAYFAYQWFILICPHKQLWLVHCFSIYCWSVVIKKQDSLCQFYLTLMISDIFHSVCTRYFISFLRAKFHNMNFTWRWYSWSSHHIDEYDNFTSYPAMVVVSQLDLRVQVSDYWGLCSILNLEDQQSVR